jgi:ribosomal protein S18 acetylase RimI-like enzyme
LPGLRNQAAMAQRKYRTRDGETITIRGAAVEDVPRLLQIWQKTADEGKYIATERVGEDFRGRLEGRVADRDTLVAVAEHRGMIVGSLTLYQYYGNLNKTKRVYSLGMVVLKGYRSIGIGSSLMDYAIRWARHKGIRKLSLEVFSTNEAATHLYRKFGFEVEGTRKGQFQIAGRYVDEVIMGLFLSARPRHQATGRGETLGRRAARTGRRPGPGI